MRKQGSIKVVKKERGKVLYKDEDGQLKRVPYNMFKYTVKKILLERQEGCGVCHIDLPDVLLIHHLDRDHDNNNLDNLQLLCHNCHMLTHFKPRALYKMVDWRGREPDAELLRKIIEVMKKAPPPDTALCTIHEDRKSEVIIGFDPATGKPLPEEKQFGACPECWEVLLDQKPELIGGVK